MTTIFSHLSSILLITVLGCRYLAAQHSDPHAPLSALAFYGDGSDGALTISSSVDWSTNPPSGMLRFSSLTITSTGSLTVPSGLVIRVRDHVTIGGPITVGPLPFIVPQASAAGGGCVPFFGLPFGAGNVGLKVLEARTLLRPPQVGYAAINNARGGGGTITILAAGSIVITSTGSISAAGASGGAPGIPYPAASAGGIIILASRTSIQNGGVLIATGGNGADGNAEWAAGGGGGGGIIHLLGPSLAVGNANVSGGAGGSNGKALNAGGFPLPGGACGGSGGASDATGSPGTTGQVFATHVSEPVALFIP